MSEEEVKATIRRVVEGACNQGGLDPLGEIYAADVVSHRSPLPDIRGLAALKLYVADIRTTFSAIQLAIEEIMLDGNASAVVWSLQATHTGRSAPIPVPPTGRRIAIAGCTVSHWAKGKVIEEQNHVDWLGLFHQLGVIPPLDYYCEDHDR